MAMLLAAISTASGQNTRESAKDRIGRDSPYWTQAYGDVCAAIDRELALRERLEKAFGEITRLSMPSSSVEPERADLVRALRESYLSSDHRFCSHAGLLAKAAAALDVPSARRSTEIKFCPACEKEWTDVTVDRTGAGT